MPNLVGIGNSQVPTNAMLGGLAYQDPAHANLTEVQIENIAAIRAKTSNEATSVFIYDTSKDSDGGAWRKRTQDASWYNEGPGQYRGTRKEFPAVAVLVAEAQKLTIYDGDDPNLSMWMIFLSGGYGQAASRVIQANGTNLDITDIHMLNGQLVVAQSQGYDSYGSPVINFISERAVRMDPQSTEGGRWFGNISQRNTNQEWYQYGGYAINSSLINCCTQFVDPNADIDNDTGLPRPTIFVGCHNSVNQIHSNETVDGDISPPGSSYACIAMTDVNSKGQVVCVFRNGNVIVTYLYNLKDKVDPDQDNTNYYYYNAAMNTWPSIHWHPGSEKLTWVDDDKLALSNGMGVHLYLGGIDNVGGGTRTFAFLNKDHPTGYLRRINPVATCASISTETLTASTQLITAGNNGTFSSNITGWGDKSGGGSNIIHSTANGGRMDLNGNAATARAYVTITTVVGEWYMVWTKPLSSLFSGSQTMDMFVGTHEYPNSNYQHAGSSRYTHGTSDANEPITVTWRATQTTYHILIESGHNVAVDNVYAMKVAEDVSSNNGFNTSSGSGHHNVSSQPLDKGLVVYGTVARTPAATGSEIVTYNFGATSKYLEQPYNSELNFLQNNGNSYTVMAWGAPTDSTAGWKPLISLDYWTGNKKWFCGALDKMSLHGGAIGNTILETNQLYFMCWVRNGSTGTNYAYLNGRLDGTNSDGQVAAPNQTLMIGCRHANGQSSTDVGGSVTDGGHWSKVALVRISAGYTDADMINKIYNEERKLFHPNAKCTLDNDSNNIRDTSYDKDTGLFHILSANTRNDFNGLVRINSETRSSGGTVGHRAISSVNGMIVEEE